MEKKPEMKDVTDPNEAFKILGVNSEDVVAPDGSKITIASEEELVEPKNAAAAEVTTETEKVEGTIVPEEKPQEEKPSEEQRRTWQGTADKAVKDLQVEQAKTAKLTAQVQAMQGVMAPLMEKYNLSGNGQAPQQQVVEEGEPEPDYMDGDFFDPKKFSEWQKKRDGWLRRSLKEDAKKEYRQENDRTLANEQISEVADKFPEYINPLTGVVDTNRLYRDIQMFTGKKSMLDIINEMKGIKPEPEKILDPSLKAIEDNADKPSTVVSSPGGEQEITTEDQETAKKFKEYGITDLPANFDGIEK